MVGQRERSELEAELGLGDLESGDLDVPLSRRTLHYVRFYSEDEQGRRWFEQLYQRSGRYRTAIEDALRAASLPRDLLWLVGAESSFDPNATSPAKAAGLWQLIPAVGTSYGLRIDAFVDERRSLEHSTRVGTRHLRKMLDELGSLELAMAAYNAGSGRITRAIEELRERRQARGETPGPIGFGHLAADELLPQETAEYVPRIAAMAIVAANLQRFNFAHVVPHDELRTTPIVVSPETRLASVARAAGITLPELRTLNPALLAEAVPPGRDSQVLVPSERYSRALAMLPVIADEDAKALDDLPEGDAVAAAEPIPKAPAPPESTPPADFELAMSKLELARLVLDAPLPGDGLGDFGKLAFAGKSQLLAKSHKQVLWVTGDGSPKGGPADARLAADVSALLASDATEEAVGHGITLRLERDATASRTAITVSFRSGGPTQANAPLSTVMVRQLESEVRFTDVVRPTELDVGLSLALGRLGLLIEQARRRPAAALRARLERHRRLAVEKLPQGVAWLALSDLLFHPEHPAFGRVLDPRGSDADQLRDRALLAEMPSVRMPGQATVTLAGNFEPDEAKQRVALALASLGLGMDGREPAGASGSPKKRVDFEAPVAGPLMLVGHELPAPDTADHAAALVVLELLGGKKRSWLVRELAEARLATSVGTHLDLDWESAVGTLVIEPRDASQGTAIEQHLDKAVAHLVDEGPTRVELAYAKGMIVFGLQKQLERLGAGAVPPGPGKPNTSPERMLEALHPGHHKRLLARVEKVNAAAVKRAAKAHFGAEARRLVEVRPAPAEGTIAAAAPP